MLRFGSPDACPSMSTAPRYERGARSRAPRHRPFRRGARAWCLVPRASCLVPFPLRIASFGPPDNAGRGGAGPGGVVLTGRGRFRLY